MNIPKDKLLHLAAGAIAAGIGMLVWALADQLLALEYKSLAVAALAGAVCAGFTKEATDRLENLRAKKNGRPPPHDASWLDMGYTAAAGLAAAGVVLVLPWVMPWVMR